MGEHTDHIGMDDVMTELGVRVDEEDIITVPEVDVVAMACCNKTNGACWTQM